MEEENETTALLQRQQTETERRSYQQSVRRSSTSAGLFPPHPSQYRGHYTAKATEDTSALAIWVVIPISLLGVFVANADGSLVVASSQFIASEFDALFSAQWLVTSFGLAQAASQPIYGKLSNIFGRKSNLVTAYGLFAIGCFICGAGNQYWQLLLGRAVSGVGGAGMTALVSVIITDIVPVRDVAAWRSYVNIAATTGRALGGPIGGWLCDVVGWRWCFYGQVPLTVIGLLSILWKMPMISPISSESDQQSFKAKLHRIDFVGAFSLAASICALLLTLDFLTRKPDWKVAIPGVSFLLLSAMFYLTEKYWAKEPILPLRLLIGRPALTSYLQAGFQMAAQFATFYSTPLYYQLVAGSSISDSGLRLVPAVVGNATAGLIIGYSVSKTGRYKAASIIASSLASVGYALILLRWRGSTNWYETLYIFLGGFGSGATQSTTFIHLAANMELQDMAIAGTTLYSFQNIFLLLGIQSATTVSHTYLRTTLNTRLNGYKQKHEILQVALSSVKAIRHLPSSVQSIVVGTYIESLTGTFGLSLCLASLGLVTALTIQERRLE